MGRKEQIDHKKITDNSEERINITWDGERFAIIQFKGDGHLFKTVILNPKEAQAIAKFIKEV